jgi:hypothetical protein
MRLSTNLLKCSAATILGMGLTTASAQALTISPTNDQNTLVNNLLDLNSGITVNPNSINYVGGNNASGTFSDGSVIGFDPDDSGIILTTGNADNAEGPNSADNTTTGNGLPGDFDLDTLIPGSPVTQDATILEFDFETTTGDLFFDYIFASEEYNEFTNSQFNDVFGFFLDGQNIALIPGTNTPVAINTVNGGNPFGTNASNPDLYNNNDPNDPGPSSFNIEYDGFTDVFTAQAMGLSPGTHTIKLAIADTGDANLDSAVLIDNFTDVPSSPEPSSLYSLLAFVFLATGSAFYRRNQHN